MLVVVDLRAIAVADQVLYKFTIVIVIDQLVIDDLSISHLLITLSASGILVDGQSVLRLDLHL